jgi:hypothetical protein
MVRIDPDWGKRKALIGGIVGAIIAISLIAAGTLVFSNTGGGSFFGIGGANHTTTGTFASSTSGSSGTLQLSMIDPPNVPGNVVDVYVNYSSIQVHVANAGNQSGWYNVTSSGTINLMKIVSSSKLLGSASLPNGTYNIVRFNITSAIVTVNSTSGVLSNSTAKVPSGMVQSVITGGVNVKANSVSALLVDISPRVTYGGNQYTLVPSASAQPTTPVSNGSVATQATTTVTTTSVTQSQHTTTSVSTQSHTT